MNLWKHFADWWLAPKKQAAKLLPELIELREQLNKAINRPPLDAIVSFFDIVSMWHDRIDEVDNLISSLEKVNYGQHTKLIQNLMGLRKHFEDAGRSRYGWNRTTRGQTVTEDTVFLGNIFGLWTFPVRHWKSTRNQARDIGTFAGFTGMREMNAYDVVCCQATRFITPHAIGIRRAISWLENNL